MINKNVIRVQEREFKSRYSIPSDESIAVKRLLRQLNVLTLYKPLSDNFSGMCLKRGDSKFILVNSNHPKSRQHFTIAHELYHLFIQAGEIKPHVCNTEFSGNIQEQEADYFASIFLMPEMGVMKMIPTSELETKNITISTVISLENYFGVSRSTMLIRMQELRLITENQHKEFKRIPVLRSALEHGYDLALYNPANEDLIIGDYGDKAKRLFDEGKISEGHYLELLQIIGIDPEIELP